MGKLKKIFDSLTLLKYELTTQVVAHNCSSKTPKSTNSLSVMLGPSGGMIQRDIMRFTAS